MDLSAIKSWTEPNGWTGAPLPPPPPPIMAEEELPSKTVPEGGDTLATTDSAGSDTTGSGSSSAKSNSGRSSIVAASTSCATNSLLLSSVSTTAASSGVETEVSFLLRRFLPFLANKTTEAVAAPAPGRGREKAGAERPTCRWAMVGVLMTKDDTPL